MKKEGFSLIELMIVLAIITSLAVITCVSRQCFSETTTVLKDKAANALNEQLALYKNVFGDIPDSVSTTQSAVNFLHQAQLIQKRDTDINLTCKGAGNNFVFIASNSIEDNEKINGNLIGWQNEELSHGIWTVRDPSSHTPAGINHTTKEKSWDFDTLQKAANILFR